MDKQAFIQACREGGAAIERALRMLDASYFDQLYREGLRTLRDGDAARDAVQDAFIRVWQRCATFQGQSELLPWIRAILRNTMLDRLRRAGRELSWEDDAVSAEAERRLDELAGDANPGPQQDLRASQHADCFQRCWERFEREAPAHAAVIAWIAQDGLSNEEVAELLGRTPGATREYISQCRKRARVYLAEWYELEFSDA